MKRDIDNINSKKATTKGDIPVKIVKSNCDVMTPVLIECFDKNIKNSAFSNELKNADISPLYKKNDRHYQWNYRPVRICRVSKPFERSLYEQIDRHIKDISS